MRYFFSFFFFLFITVGILGQKNLAQLSEVVVAASAPKPTMPFSSTIINDSALRIWDNAKDIPFIIEQTPSALAYSDAGNGVGYTGLRIRGSDLTRINVTLNGVPYNDAESHSVYFVDIADIVSSAKSISIQRGVGISVQGTSSFGAAIAINTLPKDTSEFMDIIGGYGSFNTIRKTIKLGTGKIGNWLLEGRITQTTSDGYVDRASSDLLGANFTLAYKPNERFESVFLYITGKEKTYLSWNGITKEDIKQDRTKNYLGLRSDREPYPEETDNYEQHHFQWINNFQLGKNKTLHSTTYASFGSGFYQEFKQDKTLSDYGIANDKRIQDIEQQKHLANQLWGQQLLFVAKLHQKHQLSLSTSTSYYLGKHFGKILSASIDQTKRNYTYYDFPAYKLDVQAFATWQWTPSPKWLLFGDVQWRHISYQIKGFEDQPSIHHKLSYHFFNPKLGIRYRMGGHSLYASLGISNREPVRNDFENSLTSIALPESLYDVELGYRWKSKRFFLSANLYGMFYKNQLVLTGKINDVGSYTRENVGSSYRLGIEVSYKWQLFKLFSLDGNASISRSQIHSYTQYIATASSSEKAFTYQNMPIAFSPNFILRNTLSFSPHTRWMLSLSHQFVDRQFLDNTGSILRSLDAYHQIDGRVRFIVAQKKTYQFLVQLHLQNLSSEFYAPNGYTYSEITASNVRQDHNYFFPAATFHYMLSIQLRIY